MTTDMRAIEAREIASMAEAYRQAGYEMDRQNPHRTRRAYLRGLASEYGVPLPIVLQMAATLGPAEDFDGLLAELEDLAEIGEFDGFE